MGKAVPTLQENHRLCQSWGAVNPCRKNMCGNPNICTLQMLGLQSPPCDQTLSLCLSPASKFVLLELIVPWEDRLEEAFERKLSKDAGLVPLTVSRLVGEQGVPGGGWMQGFAACSLARAFSCLGIEGERE